MRKPIIKAGDKYNRLTAIKFDHKGKNRNQYWLFKCDCGNEKVLDVNSIKRENTKSCGCLRKEGSQNGATHGMEGTRIYNSWSGMKQRCLNPNATGYNNYGGRGITICPEWLKSFINFFKDMGDRPEGKTLDRKDNDLGYSKKNCRWATPKEQSNNQRIIKNYA